MVYKRKSASLLRARKLESLNFVRVFRATVTNKGGGHELESFGIRTSRARLLEKPRNRDGHFLRFLALGRGSTWTFIRNLRVRLDFFTYSILGGWAPGRVRTTVSCKRLGVRPGISKSQAQESSWEG